MISLRHVFADRIGLQTPEPRKPSQTEKILVNHIIMTHHFHLKALVYLAVWDSASSDPDRARQLAAFVHPHPRHT